MSCVGGLNEFVTVTVPALNGEGAVVDVSNLVAKKTFFLSGAFDGEYVILGSHDNIRFVPILSFNGKDIPSSGPNAAAGPQTIKREIELTLRSIRVRRAANRTVNVSVAGQAVCVC